MKKLLVILVLLASSFAYAKGTALVEPSIQFESPQRSVAIIDGSLAWTFPSTGDKLGFYTFFWLQEGWGQVYGGPTWAFTDWLTIGLNVGAEQTLTARLRLRYAVSALIIKDAFWFYGVAEFYNDALTGKESLGTMYDVTGKYTVLTQPWLLLNVGARAHHYVGIGPYVDFFLPDLFSTVWINWAPYEPEGLDLWLRPGEKFNPGRFWIGWAAGF